MILSFDVSAGNEEATTIFKLHSATPVCYITHPDVVDLGTIVSTGNFSGLMELESLAEFDVSVNCSYSESRPNVRLWVADLKYPNAPTSLVMQPLASNSNKMGEMIVQIKRKDSPVRYMCLTKDPQPYWGNNCFGYADNNSSGSQLYQFIVDGTIDSDVLGDLEGSINIEVYYK